MKSFLLRARPSLRDSNRFKRESRLELGNRYRAQKTLCFAELRFAVPTQHLNMNGAARSQKRISSLLCVACLTSKCKNHPWRSTSDHNMQPTHGLKERNIQGHPVERYLEVSNTRYHYLESDVHRPIRSATINSCV